MTDVKVDIALIDQEDGIPDIEIAADGDFETVAGFETALKMVIQTEMRAEVPNILARHGWIGNDGKSDAESMGSLLWEIDQSRLDDDTKNFAVDAVKDAINRRLSKYFDDLTVTGVLGVDNIAITATITVNGQSKTYNFNLWENTP